ncbi:hypothetical protein BBW65_01505 [Helicobacter enhydrae]|uniref:DUF3943 domain-containing protein n=2 Tax=Helicobacter enhydrae TaxID=222136 RepID=A0A1B1U474_9HELI|nr:hypothetical protein BBW65_01505 [Helicobacter enhydrae]
MIGRTAVLFSWFVCSSYAQDQEILQQSKKEAIPQVSKQDPFLKFNQPYYVPTSRAGYLGVSAGLTVMASFGTAGMLFMMPESVTHWDKDDVRRLGSKYWQRISNSPKVDPDDLWLNFIAHPYCGAIYYLQSRRAGFNWAFSAFYGFLFSTFFWEYGIEAFAETPSWQDLVVTPAIGALLGEGFYRLINAIQNNDSKVLDSRFLGGLCLFVLDPLGFVIQDLQLGSALGIKNRNQFQSFYVPKADGIALVARYSF